MERATKRRESSMVSWRGQSTRRLISGSLAYANTAGACTRVSATRSSRGVLSGAKGASRFGIISISRGDSCYNRTAFHLLELRVDQYGGVEQSFLLGLAFAAGNPAEQVNDLLHAGAPAIHAAAAAGIVVVDVALGISQALGQVVQQLLGIVGIGGHGRIVILHRVQIRHLPSRRAGYQLGDQVRLLSQLQI